jgi:hypothetical protein
MITRVHTMFYTSQPGELRVFLRDKLGDDIHKTVAEFREWGVQFTDEVSDMRYGLGIHFKVPGDFRVELYQPLYRTGRAGA